jgi:hypothetical protein
MKLFRAAVFWWLLAFATGGMFALSCPSCGVHATKPEATITLPRSEWSRVMTVLVTRREERDLARAERDEARSLVRIERNSCASKLVAKDLEIAAVRKSCRPPTCDGWKISTGVALGLVGVCAVTLTVREVAR